jgi:hypothetical protein
MNPPLAPIRPARLAVAWLLCIACGCAGAAAWMLLFRWAGAPAQDGLLWRGLSYCSLFAAIGAGIYGGMRLSRGFLSGGELAALFRLQP